jgi:hypothetical protein
MAIAFFRGIGAHVFGPKAAKEARRFEQEVTEETERGKESAERGARSAEQLRGGGQLEFGG